MSSEDRYRQAGVDIEKGNQFVRMIAPLVKATHNELVQGDIGGFSGLMGLPIAGMSDPLLVSSTDGVGTKLKIAFLMDKHDTVGIDLVGMVINDIVVTGARPLFMLDYLATGKLSLETASQVVAGIAQGCTEARTALIGGETAEMPGFYPPGEYDLAGFGVGVVDRKKVIDGSRVTPGAVLLGLPSSGLHSNGFSLVRRVVFEEQGLKVGDRVEELGCTVGEELLTPTRIYVKAVAALQEAGEVLALAHITGGGLLENIPRALPSHCRALLRKGSWPTLPIFEYLRRAGGLSPREMGRTFNSGLGMVAMLPAEGVDAALAALAALDEPAYVVGEVAAWDGDGPQVVWE